MQVHHLLEESFSKYPESKSLWYDESWYTYKQLNDLADSIAAYLVHQNISRGDRVAILLDNSFHYITAYFGILKAGAVVVGLNTETNTESLNYLLNDSESRCIITQNKYYKLLKPALEKCSTISDVIMTDSEGELISLKKDRKITVESINNIKSKYTIVTILEKSEGCYVKSVI